MHIYISICVTLLTLIAALHLILKAHNQGMNAIFKWISYLIVLTGLCILICQVARGINMMRHHDDDDDMEECHGMMRGHHGMMGGMHGMDNCCFMYKDGKMECCDMDKDKKACCDEMMEGDSTHKKMECKVIVKHMDGDKEEHEEHEEKK